MSPTSSFNTADDGRNRRSRIGLAFDILMCGAVVAAIFFVPGVLELVLGTLVQVLTVLFDLVRWFVLFLLLPVAAGGALLVAIWLFWVSRNELEDRTPVRRLVVLLVVLAVGFAAASVYVHSFG